MKNVLKRSLSVLLAITIIFSSAYVGLSEVDFSGIFAVRAKAASESDLTFTLNDDGTSYSVTDCSTSASGSLVIPSTYEGEPVTSIGSSAFSSCTSVTSVTIPYGVTSMGSYVFSGCTSLTSVTIPDSVTIIGQKCFENTKYYDTTTNWENNVLYVGKFLIEAKEEISGNYTVKTSTKVIAYHAFNGCVNLEKIVIADGVTHIGDYAFNGCTNLSSVTISNSVTTIGNFAFEECVNIANLTIPDAVTTIGDYAFNGCTNLSSVIIPYSVTSIGDYTFKDCTSLVSINVDDNNSSFCSVEGVLFDKEKNTLIKYPASKDETEYIIPDSVTSLGGWAFHDCSKLIAINANETNETFSSLEGVLFNKDKTELIKYPMNKQDTTYEILSSVKTIKSYAFAYNANLISIKIPDSVSGIGVSAFKDCNRLAGVYITDIVKWCAISFNAGSAFSTGTLVSSSSNPLLSGGNLYLNGELVTDLVIPSDITNIGKYAFNGCTSIRTVTINEGATNIGGAAFRDCVNLESIAIPVSVTDIGGSAFGGCKSLTYVFYAGTSSQWDDISISGYLSGFNGLNGYLYSACQTGMHYEATDHYAGEWIVTQEPTCTEAGVKVGYCEVCYYVYTNYPLLFPDESVVPREEEVIPALGHEYLNDWIIDYEATCNAEGSKSRYCSRCGETEFAVIEKTGHSYGEWEILDEVSCDVDGVKQRECSVCGEIETETEAATGHNYSTEWTIDKEATCTENGSKSHHCINCGDRTDVTVIVATGHIVGEWVVTTESTCSQEGVKTGYCGVCGEECSSEAVSTLEHNYDYDNYEYVINPDNSAECVKQHKCKDCDATTLGTETFIAVVTVDDLYNVRNNLSGNYVLMNDIDLTEATSINRAYDFMDNGWNPIGSGNIYGANAFSGTFDGNSHEIKGMRIEVTTVPSGATTLNLGLFAKVIGTVKNLSVSGSIESAVYNEKYVGSICGYLDGTVENCSANCEIVVSNENSSTKNSYAGGIVGYADDGSVISQCYNIGNISGTCVGGILGYGYIYYSQGEITIKNCYNIGSLVGSTYCGGIVGRDWRYYTSSYFYIEDCYNRGNISSDKYCMIENNYDRKPSITTSYYLEGLGISQTGATALNEQMMQKQSAYTGFDFDEIWIIDTSSGYLYPQLRNNLHRGGCHHIYSDWIVVSEASCETDGVKYRECASCGETETITESATGHNYSTEWTIDSEATCTTSGSKSHHCLNCGEKSDITVIESTGHAYGHWVVTTEPTCTELGSAERYCDACGYTQDYFEFATLDSSLYPVVDGDYQETEVDGYQLRSYSFSCSGAESLILDFASAKLSHFSSSINVYDENGETIGFYNNYGGTLNLSKPIIVPGSGFIVVLQTPSGNSFPTFSFDSIAIGHECVNYIGHNYSTEWTMDIAATCTTTGSKSHHCLNCGDKADVTEIVATGHIVGEWVVTTEPTCTQEGVKTGYCGECGIECATEAVPTTEHNYDYDNYEYVQNPDNLNEISKQYKCTDCGTTKLDDKPAVVKSLIIESLPDNTSYIEGQEIDTTGLVVKAEFEDGETIYITDYEISYDNSVSGEQEVTISCGDATATFTVTFAAKTLVSITVTKMPDKTTYVVGDSFDKTGMIVTATYDNGLSEEVTDFTVSTLPKTTGTKNLIVTYSGKRVIIQVTVIEKTAVSMTVVEPEKFEYVLGDEFDPTGMVVTVTFNNGATEEVTDYTIEGFGDFTGVGYVTLKYDELTYDLIILMHSPADSWVIETPATCTADGIKHLYCTECGEIAKTDIIFATGHEYTDAVIKEATCLEKGVKQYDCQYCDASYTEEFGGAHKISGEKIVLEPTCDEAGEKYSLCSVCGETVGEPVSVPALGHDYSTEFTVDIKATCTQEGSKSRHCSRCNAMTEVTIIEPTAHNYSDWQTTIAATCETAGERIRGCSICNVNFVEVIEPYGHAYSVIWTTDKTATCTVDGLKSHHCNRCDAKTDVTVIPALGHNFGEWIELDVPSCTAPGKKVQICAECGIENVEEIPSLGHKNGDWIIDSVADCENDGLRHAFCSVCNAETLEVIKAYGHDYQSVFTVDVEATCTESGSKSHHCSRCDSKADITTIQPLGHHISTMWTIDTEPTCETEGSKSHHCLRCDFVDDVTVIPVASHIYGKWEIVTPATMDTAGVRAHKCYNCEMTEEAELPKLLKYTATFVADGDVVATVDFPEDATEIEIPEVPHKDKFNGEWENFDVRNKNFTVNAVYTPIPTEQIDGITAGNKTDYYSSTGEVEINLNVSAPSKTIVTTTTKAVPLDIIFVLDQSGSMADGGKKNALKNAVTSFSNEILADAITNSVDHRIAVVGFASGSNHNLNYQNTELLTADVVKYNKITNADYKNALVSVNDNGALNELIADAVNAIDAEGATRADLGLEMATNIFANNPITDNRQRVVVFLTDGEPTSYNGFEYSVANVAIQNAYQLKNTYDATVYSVGVFDNADSKVSNFMNYVSSNYNEEVVMKKSSKETTENTNGYYLDVSDVSTLSEVFTSIVEETTTHTGRFTNATLKYTLTKYFTLTSIKEEAIRKNAIEKLGATNDQISITRNADGTTTIVIKGVEPWEDGEAFVIDFTFRATANGNTLKSGTYQVGTFESGVILENGEGYEAVFAPNSVDISGTSGIAVFNINSIPYAINRLSSTTKVVAPATSFGTDYNFIGWYVPANLTLNNEVKVFEAELLKNEYKISWNIDGEIIEAIYSVGDFITVPQVGNNSIGGAFVGWDKVIPETMPSENLTITAIYDAHYHKYDVTKDFENCTEGGTLTYTCECGDSYTEEIEACEHSWEVITASNNQKAIENAGSRCSVCGIKDSKALRLEGKDIYQESDASYNTAKVELDYVDENGEKYQPDGDIEISVQLDEVFETDVPVDATANVYRVNDDGSRTLLESEQDGMNMTFTTDHFSTYEFEFTTGEQKYLFAENGAKIDYTKKLIFSSAYATNDIKSIATYLVPGMITDVKINSSYFATGSTFDFSKDGVTDNYKIIINGDLNGDGVCNVLDAMYAERVSSGHVEATEEEIYAANGCVSDELDVSSYQNVVNMALAS